MSAEWPSRTRGLDAADLDDPGEDVGERQEEQRGGSASSSGVEERVELGDGHGQLEHEVAVGEHAALGPAGRARGVDEGGQVVGPAVRTTLARARRRRRPRPGSQDPTAVALDRPHVVQVGKPVAHLLDPGAVLGRSRRARRGRRSRPGSTRPGRRWRSRRRARWPRRRTRWRSRAASTRSGCARSGRPGRPPRSPAAISPWRPPAPPRGTRAAVTSAHGARRGAARRRTRVRRARVPLVTTSSVRLPVVGHVDLQGGGVLAHDAPPRPHADTCRPSRLLVRSGDPRRRSGAGVGRPARFR